MQRLLPALIVATALAGCTRDDVTYPSLALRPVEQLSFDEPEPPAPKPVAPDPELDVEVAAATARLDKAAADFTRQAGEAEAAARRARGVRAGGDAWLDAQTALAQLDILRAEASEVLTGLEELSVARATTLAAPYPALEQVRDRVRDELRREEEAIARIGSTLAPGV